MFILITNPADCPLRFLSDPTIISNSATDPKVRLLNELPERIIKGVLEPSAKILPQTIQVMVYQQGRFISVILKANANAILDVCLHGF